MSKLSNIIKIYINIYYSIYKIKWNNILNFIKIYII